MEGFMENSRGAWVPEEIVAPVDKLRDDLVQQMVQNGIVINELLVEFKAKAFEEIKDFVELSASDYDVKIGGDKGNLSLLSFDGKFKVTRSIAEHMVFDERLQVAKELIDECLKDWSASSGPELKAIVNGAFQVDKKGNVNAKNILALRKHDIEDARWLRAMAAIGDSLTVTGSKAYIRLYKRIDGTDEYVQIPLDLSSV